MAKHGRAAIGRKIKKLKREGKTQKQAVGQALGMARHKKKSSHNSGHRKK